MRSVFYRLKLRIYLVCNRLTIKYGCDKSVSCSCQTSNDFDHRSFQIVVKRTRRGKGIGTLGKRNENGGGKICF